MALTLNTITLENIQASFDPALFDSALDLVQQGNVSDLERDRDNKLNGYVFENRKFYAASLSIKDSNLHMACECAGLTDGPCVHVVALLVAFVIEHQNIPEGVEEGGLADPQPGQAAGRPVDPHSLPQIFPAAGQQEIQADWKKRLENLTIRDMRELAAAWGLKIKATLRDQILTALLDWIALPETLPRVLEKQPPDSLCVLDFLCCLYRTVPFFTSEQVSPYLQAGLAGGQKARPVQDCLDDLSRAGLFIPFLPGNLFQVPLQVLAMPRVNPHLFKPWSGEPQQIEAAQPFRFTRLGLRLLLMAQSDRLPRASQARQASSKSWPEKSPADRNKSEIEVISEPAYLESELCATLARELALPPGLLDLVTRLLDTGGLGSIPASRKGNEKLPAWLKLSPQEQSRRLFALAAQFPTQFELDLARSASFSAGFSVWRTPNAGLGYTTFMNSLGLARLRLVRLLARLPQGRWFEIDSILRTLHGLQPGWLPEIVSRSNGSMGDRYFEHASIWAGDKRARVNPLNYEDWSSTAYGPFYRTMLAASLPWLGLLDVALQNGGPVAVRLSEFGEFLVERRADFPLPAVISETASLVMDSSGRLLLDPETASLDLINLVVQIAQPENAAGQLARLPGATQAGVQGGVSAPRKGPGVRRSAIAAPIPVNPADTPGVLSYRISETHLGEAFEAGWTLEAITASLQAGLRAPLPAALRERLQNIWDGFGRLQIYEDMTLMELGDDFALPELLAGTSLSQILLYTFSPRLVAVRSAALENYLAELQAKGYTPRVEPASGAQRGR